MIILIEQFGIKLEIIKTEMKRILIIDSTSMAGHMISEYLSLQCKYQISNIVVDKNFISSANYLDIYNPKAIEQEIKTTEPEIIIYCSRILIDESENKPAKAIYFNSFLPHYFEEITCLSDTKIIHLSTDCVFSGSKGNYLENDLKNGANFYARSKSLGEIINGKDLTIRTSFIGPNIGERNEELFHWFMMQKGTIYGFNNVFWTGVTTLELAKCIDKAIEIDLRGLYHLVPNEKITKYDLLQLIKQIWKRDDLQIKKNDIIHSDKSLLDSRKLLKVENYQTMFEELHQWMMDYKLNYNQYFNY